MGLLMPNGLRWATQIQATGFQTGCLPFKPRNVRMKGLLWSICSQWVKTRNASCVWPWVDFKDCLWSDQKQVGLSTNILLVLGASFTLKDARMVYSPFLKTPINQIDNSNFKKSHRHLFTAVGTSADNRPGRPARVYKLAFIGAWNKP